MYSQRELFDLYLSDARFIIHVLFAMVTLAIR